MEICFKIYRKPTATDQTIHSASFNQKIIAAYNSLVHCLLSVALKKPDYNHELSIIKHIVLVNTGYRGRLIEE